jgi:hypothetical protein
MRLQRLIRSMGRVIPLTGFGWFRVTQGVAFLVVLYIVAMTIKNLTQ